MNIIDISPLIQPGIAVFPGDTPYKRNILMDFSYGDHLLLSGLQATLHLGAHADAPNHYHPKGVGIDKRPIHPYLGLCQVIHVPGGADSRILPHHLEGRPIRAPRVLFATGSFPDPNCWCDDFKALSPELLDMLAAQQVVLVGIDTPSVDPAPAKDLISHNALFRGDFAVLEGLVLSHVPEGLYNLVALPLKIQDADAAPVRAVLIDGGLADPRQL